jgi:hypothetical protein
MEDTVATLGEAQADEHAISTALAQPAVASILAQHRAWLERTATWTSCSGRTLGRIVSFQFERPATFTATLPKVAAPKGDFAYSTSVEKVLATAWGELNVSVDTNARTVVGVDGRGYVTSGRADGLTVPLATVVPPHDAGGRDSRGCWQSGD